VKTSARPVRGRIFLAGPHRVCVPGLPIRAKPAATEPRRGFRPTVIGVAEASFVSIAPGHRRKIQATIVSTILRRMQVTTGK
jgi:hypothetical protein